MDQVKIQNLDYKGTIHPFREIPITMEKFIKRSFELNFTIEFWRQLINSITEMMKNTLNRSHDLHGIRKCLHYVLNNPQSDQNHAFSKKFLLSFAFMGLGISVKH